jgi:hypothetical protein
MLCFSTNLPSGLGGCLAVLQTVKVEEPVDDEAEPETKDDTEKEADEADDDDDDDDDTKVEEDKQEEKAKTKTIEKTVWDWEVLNDSKPIWTRKYVFFNQKIFILYEVLAFMSYCRHIALT